MREMLLVLQRIGLRKHAAIGMASKLVFPSLSALRTGLYVLGHVLGCIELGSSSLGDFPDPALVDENQSIMPGQQVQVREE